MKIYTKTGDKGTTALFTGERRPKNDPIFEALGATDELSSHIALAREFAQDNGHSYDEKLRRIQCILQDVASMIATPKSSARESHLKRVGISNRHVQELEEWIDEYTAELPPLENFILPGGGKASSSLHIARTVCRRAERAITPLVRENDVDPQALIYVNRLSDFLFTVARYAAKLDNREETIYIREDPTK
ncbi:Cob(I)yrinic acid a,c-diamide adenosyltransferase, mitochondrial [Orchesella cincta]|uniref:Corrinoid adenosyltransferase MMAB n=1 Tax=Orchesella cincta TaxID=48709 RepID=A0A1D2ND57_ORCCI|nr:Cob(I)yrinic acid a,c-diamide adenosyltransferase, mitochondrial [Orchesella cincta]